MRPAPGPAYSPAIWTRSPARSVAARARKPGFAPAICCWWMRPGWWIRTPPAARGPSGPRWAPPGAARAGAVAAPRGGGGLGGGEVIVTRRNDHDVGVANREVWTVTRVHPTGRLTVDSSGRGRRELPADYV